MQYDDEEAGVSGSCLNDLDTALNELGMLATRATSREEYLNETQSKKCLKMLTINTRFVSNVSSIGFRLRPVTPHIRYKPYKVPKERHRTRSENNDNDVIASLAKTIVEECIDESLTEITQLKKAKSLESIIAESSENSDLKNINLGNPSELEHVSNCIQNLKVAE